MFDSFLMFRKAHSEAILATERASLVERRDNALAGEMEGVKRRKKIVKIIKK